MIKMFFSKILIRVDCAFQDWREKFKGWVNAFQQSGVEVGYRKVCDGPGLRLWKVAALVEAPPVEVLHRVLRERWVHMY